MCMNLGVEQKGPLNHIFITTIQIWEFIKSECRSLKVCDIEEARERRDIDHVIANRTEIV